MIHKTKIHKTMIHKSMVHIVMLIAATVLGVATASAQSFNCRAAYQPDEVLICQNRHLAALDAQMASLYFTLRNGLVGGQRRALEREQAAWLRSRTGCGRDYGCIDYHYRQRIAALSRY